MLGQRTLGVILASTLLTFTTTIGGATAAPAAPVTTLDLELNDQVGSTTAVDDSGLGHDGAIGSHVVMNGQYAHFDRHAPGEGIPYGFDHLISVPDAADGSLDPGSGNFSVEIKYRTKESFGNVIQKGQATTYGGQVKFQQPKGKMSCMFKTPTGTATAGSGLTPLNDNQWHVVRCDRTPTSVTMYVDGVMTGRVNHTTGNLDNTRPWTIGGKSECDAVTVTCDYFAGDIDYVHLIKEQTGSGDSTPPSVTSTNPADGSTGSPRSGNYTATFSEPVTGATASTVVLRKVSTGVKFAGAVTYDASSRTVTLDPNVTLASNTAFSVTLGSGITDSAGNPLPTTTTTFTTGG